MQAQNDLVHHLDRHRLIFDQCRVRRVLHSKLTNEMGQRKNIGRRNVPLLINVIDVQERVLYSTRLAAYVRPINAHFAPFASIDGPEFGC